MRRAVIPAAALAAVLLVGGCGIGAPHGSIAVPAGPTDTPEPTVTAAVAQTRLQIAGALATAAIPLAVPTVPFRPPEPPEFASVPRAVFQATLPDDPQHGFIVVYELPDTAQATTYGRSMARYLGAGPGKVQFPPDTRHVLRQLGTTLVLYSWSPANSTGPGAEQVGTALGSIGQGIDIPR